MNFKFETEKGSAAWLKTLKIKGGKIKLKIDDLDNKDDLLFSSARSKKELKELQKSNSDIIYDQSKGKLYFNQNGNEKGWGLNNESGFFAKVIGKPLLKARDFLGYKECHQNQFDLYLTSLKPAKAFKQLFHCSEDHERQWKN